MILSDCNDTRKGVYPSFWAKHMSIRNVAFLTFPGVLALDVAGPAEVLSMATRVLGKGNGYKIDYLSLEGDLVESISGISIKTRPLVEAPRKLDTLVVAGGRFAESCVVDDPLVKWIASRSKRVRRVCSVCSGAFILAAAGLLDGRRAVTHWNSGAEFRRKYPDVELDLKPIYVHDRGVWTSAGVTAGIDLALALVEDDYGRGTALTIAKQLVVFLHRPGGQAQFSTALAAQSLTIQPNQQKFAELHSWMADHLDSDLTIAALAARARMTRRSFTRAYRTIMGETPAHAVEQIRLEAARQKLERGDASVKQIAAFCGFGDEERFRRAFLRNLGVAPSHYRARFNCKDRVANSRATLQKRPGGQLTGLGDRN